MSHIADDGFLSTLVYRCIAWVLGHEGRVRVRREIQDTWNQLKIEDGRMNIGSHAEGIRDRNGGRDENVSFTNCRVYTDIEIPECSNGDEEKCRYRMETECSPPGYCRLRVLPGKYFDADLYEVEGDRRIYLSSEKFLERCRELSVDGTVIKGFKLETHAYETIYSLRIPWPSVADEWKTRNPFRSWPSGDLIRKVIQDGCCLIPCASSTSSKTEWRICFGAAEKNLVYSFSHFHFLLYQFVRITVKDIVAKPTENGGPDVESLCNSFVIKSAFFWAMEESLPNITTERRFGQFFDICIDRLRNFVRDKSCPNYFIPSDNLFQQTMSNECQQLILDRLNGLRTVGLKCVLQCDSFRILKELVEKPPASLESQLPNAYTSELHEDQGFFHEILMFTHSLMTPNGMNTTIDGANDDLLNQELSSAGLGFIETDLTNSNKHAGIAMYDLATQKAKNKERYAPFWISRVFFQRKPRRDIGEGILMLATFFYLTGSYDWALTAIARFLARFKPYVVYHGWKSGIFGNDDRDEAYKHHVCGRGWSFGRKARESLLVDVEVLKKKPMVPSQLRLEMELLSSSVFGGFHIPPLPYAHFLKFLCLSASSSERSATQRQSVVSELQAVLFDEEMRGDYLISYGMTGICLEMMNEVDAAIDVYVKANRMAKKDKTTDDKNPSIWRIALLLNKKFISSS